ncbi:MAG: hypothetical protein WC627_00130 [Legionella sp.]|jgi:hypothetical protein
MKPIRIFKRCQVGAVLTLEYVILMLGGALGAVSLFIILGAKLPVIIDTWLNQATFDASATFQGIETAACYQIANSVPLISPQGTNNFAPTNMQTSVANPALIPLCGMNTSTWSSYYQ